VLSNFSEYFSSLEDPRIERHKQHPLEDILFFTLCAVLSACNDWDEIEEYRKQKKEWLKKHIPLVAKSNNKIININGKRLCNGGEKGSKSMIHLVNAWSNQMILRQVKTEAKSNELRSTHKYH
jgi:DDE_Tnp_1-associated